MHPWLTLNSNVYYIEFYRQLTHMIVIYNTYLYSCLVTGLYDRPCPIDINPLKQSAVIAGRSRWSTVKHYRHFFQSQQQGLKTSGAQRGRVKTASDPFCQIKTEQSPPVCHTSPLDETSLLEAHRPVWYQTHSLCILCPLDAPPGACPKTQILRWQHSACCSADDHNIKTSWIYSDCPLPGRRTYLQSMQSS